MQIRQIGPGFVAEVSDIDLSEPLADETITAIHTAMDEHAVLVFHDQNLSPDQQLAFSESLGPLEHAIGTALRGMKGDRLPTTFADISNLDENNQRFARDDRRRLFAIGNRLWHSDSSFKAVPAKYSLLYASTVTSKGGNTEFADMRHAYDTLDDETKDTDRRPDLRTFASLFAGQHSASKIIRLKKSNASSRFSSASCAAIPATGRKSLFLSSHIGAIVGLAAFRKRAASSWI